MQCDSLAEHATMREQFRDTQTSLEHLMQQYYAARAKEYDRIYAKPERQASLRQIEAWLPTALEGCNVLEIACGTGYWTQFYAPAARSALGIDSAQETMDIARARLPGKVSLQRGDAYDLAGISGEFDAAFAGFWWSHVPLTRLPEFLEGLHSKLSARAKVVFIDNRYVAGSSTPISDHDADGNAFQVRTLEDGSAHRVLKNFPSREELLAAVAPYAMESDYREWDYFWALEYRLK